jgi:hypothetical protein
MFTPDIEAGPTPKVGFYGSRNPSCSRLPSPDLCGAEALTLAASLADNQAAITSCALEVIGEVGVVRSLVIHGARKVHQINDDRFDPSSSLARPYLRLRPAIYP